MEQMRKAKLVRIDNPKKKIDLSNLKGYSKENKNTKFSPLLVTPTLNLELTSNSGTYLQLMNIPDIAEFAKEFLIDTGDFYIAENFNQDTIINNIIVQILLVNGFIQLEDLTRGSIVAKVNRETIAAAKFAALKILGK